MFDLLKHLVLNNQFYPEIRKYGKNKIDNLLITNVFD
jgi:hypothetical protein